MPEPETAAIEADHELLIGAVREAGARALELFGTGVRQWKKPDGTPVSHADIVVDEVLKERLVGGRPGYGWLSEETLEAADLSRPGRVWVVDPIDGTRAFLRGAPHWSVSVALVEDARPVAAAVFNPATGQLFEAVAGRGARLNGEPIRASQRDELAGARILVQDHALRSRRWREPWPELQSEMRNSIAYRLCLVASGEFDALISMNPKSAWDLAAGDLIVAEAGGMATTHDGRPFVYDRAYGGFPNVAAAGPGLHAELVRRTGAATIARRSRQETRG